MTEAISYASASAMREAYKARRARLSRLCVPPPPPPPPPTVAEPPDNPAATAILTLAEAPVPPSRRQVVVAVSKASKVPVSDINSPRRDPPIVDARNVYFALLKLMTPLSNAAIGHSPIAPRHRTTVDHGIHKVAADPDKYRPMIEAACRLLNRPTPDMTRLK